MSAAKPGPKLTPPPGMEDAAQRAHHTWREWPEQYQPPPLDPVIDDALRDYVNRRGRELVGKNLYG